MWTYVGFSQSAFGFTGYLSSAPWSVFLYWWHWWLAAPDSQLHKLIHPWSLASMGTYTLLFLFTLLIAKYTSCLGFLLLVLTSISYGLTWWIWVSISLRKEGLWRKLNMEGDRLETSTLIYSTTLVETLIEARHFASGVCWSKTLALSPRKFQINGRAGKTFP